MTRKFILVVAAILVQQATTLAQTNSLVKYLPGNALLVMNFDVVRLVGKIPAETLQKSGIYQEMLRSDKMPIATLLKEPLKSGIDFFPGVFVVVTNDAQNETPNPGVNIFIKLSNAEVFTAKMKELYKENNEAIKTFGTDNIIQAEKGMTLGWNKEIIVITSSYDSKIKDELQSLYINDSAVLYLDTVAVATDNTPQPDYEKKELEIQQRLKLSQRNICFSLLAPTSQSSLQANKEFVSLMNTPADIRTWNNGTANPLFGNKMAGLFGAGLGKLKGLIGGSKTSAVNFENGKIVVVNNNYVVAEVAALYQKYSIAPISTRLSGRLPAGKLLGMINVSYNPQMGMELLQQTGLKQMLDDLKKPMPFDINLLYSALGNNMLLAVVKAEEGASMDSTTKEMGGMQVVAAMEITNKTKFGELKASIDHLIDSLKSGKEEKMKKGPIPVVRFNDSLVVVSLSADVANAFLNKSSTGPVPEWLQSKSEYPMLMNVNMKELIKMLLGKKMSQKAGKEEQQLLEMFDQFMVYGGKYENESLQTTMEFKFSNATDNALKQLFELINLVTEGKNGRMQKDYNDMKIEEIKQEIGNEPPPPPTKAPKKVVAKPKKNGL